MAEKSRVVFIAGPTASGKSAAALALAERTGGEIVNADAIQVYRDLEILSARPRPEDLARAPHHLYGFLDASECCSAGRWARAAAPVLAEVERRGRMAVVVGGTGLYFKALAEGLSPMPDIPAEVRDKARRRLEEIGNAAFRAEVLVRDPEMARLAVGDRQRLLRAWEVHEGTGRSLSYWQSRSREPIVAAPVTMIVIEPDRDALYRSIEARFDSMMKEGALQETARLLRRGLDPGLPAVKAVGVAELLSYLRDEVSLDAAMELAKRNTRRFAKRQLTWFRHQAAADWRRVRNSGEAIEGFRF
jgi:tRNA dimethylallyltransferase